MPINNAEIKKEIVKTDFSSISQNFLFSAKIPAGFKAEYQPSLNTINLYDPNLPGSNNTEKSQIYITYFKAGRFLTLNTVNITLQEPKIVAGREAILYEIAKKPEFPDFVGQPEWRNFKHKALDVRFSAENPTYFYSFSYNPILPESVFNEFIDSLELYQ